MGLNGHGVVAAVLNRPGSLGPAQDKRSRGTLPLMALEHPTAAAACQVVATLDGAAYRSFNLVIADRQGVWVIRNDDAGRIDVMPLPPGLHMVTAYDPDDETSPRVARHLPRFRAADAPSPPEWRDWPRLLGDDSGPRQAALSVPPEGGFGTVCASLLAVPDTGPVTWLFGPCRAGETSFMPVA